MRLGREALPDGPMIRGFSAGGFRIDDHVFFAMLITPVSVNGWTPPPIDALTVDDLAPLMSADRLPEFLLLGTGPTMIRPPRALALALDGRGVGIEAMDSRAAARAWTILRQEGRWIAGAFYPI